MDFPIFAGENQIHFRYKHSRDREIIEKNLNDLIKIINANSPINIYYFATPKIFFDIRTIYLDRLYKNYFVRFLFFVDFVLPSGPCKSFLTKNRFTRAEGRCKIIEN